MNANADFVPDPSAFAHGAPYAIQPEVEVPSEGEVIAVEDESIVPISNSFGQLTGHFLTSLAVDVPTRSANFVLTYPPPIFAAIDAALSPTSSAFSHNNRR